MQPPYTGSAADEDVEQSLEQSPPVTAQKTVDTDFLPGQKQTKQKMMIQPLINLRDGPAAARSNIISKENIGKMSGTGPMDKIINKSVSNNEKLQPIHTGTADEF
jgi:hypothetical protein